MMKAISHRGFSLVQVLSPCITWRPEHKDIKTMVHQGFAPAKDKTEARKNLMTDDGLTTGILYANPDAYVSYERNEIEPEISLKELEEQFAI